MQAAGSPPPPPPPPPSQAALDAAFDAAARHYGLVGGRRAAQAEALRKAGWSWALDGDAPPRRGDGVEEDAFDVADSPPPLAARLIARAAPDGEPEAHAAPRPRKARRKEPEEPLEDRLAAAIRADERLYEKMLLMDAVDVEDVAEVVSAAGIKCPRTKLVAYLDAQRVCYANTRARRNRTGRF